MVSALNRRPEVVGGFVDDVVVRDITLRTTEQMAGVSIAGSDRLKFLDALARAGVRSVQPSAFRRGETVERMRAEVDTLRSINPSCEVVYGGATSENHVEMAAASGVGAVQIWTAFLGGGAAICAGAVYHRAWQRRQWQDLDFPTEPSDQIDRSVRMVEIGRAHGVKVAGSINLLSYASDSYITEYSQRVAEAGAYEIVLADGSSGCGPEAFAHAVTLVRKSAPGTPVAVHTHNMFGLANACALAGLRSGAKVVEVAVNEYEHGATGADLAAVATALEALYGIPTGIRLSAMVPLARFAEELTGQALPDHHPLTGRRVFEAVGSDEYVQEYKYDSLIHCCVDPSLVGNARAPVLSHETGPFTMWDVLDVLGIAVSEPAEVNEILKRAKDLIARLNRELLADEIRAIADAVHGDNRTSPA
jgi:isopropylmalate/homocitrate/citramalate synthase